MPFQEKFVSDEIFSTLSNWLIHFLWYLLEEFMQSDVNFNGRFSLRRSAEGQRIAVRLNGQPHEIVMPCPSAVDAEVVVAQEGERLVMRPSGEKSSHPPLL